MEITTIIGSLVTQTALITITLFFVKRWMDRVDTTMKEIRGELKNNGSLLASQIEGIHVEMKLANGRTAKLEGKVDIQKAICEERHEKHID